MCKSSIGYRHGNERQNSRTDWLRQIIIYPSAIGSTQQDVIGL